MKIKKITPVILAGGKGTRLWPLSREDVPKQFCNLGSETSLFQDTILRVQDNARFNKPIIVTGERYAGMVEQQLTALKVEAEAIICEPMGRDTAAAVLLATEVSGQTRDSLLLVMPSDHLIADNEAFCRAVDQAYTSAEHGGRIVTFGIKPTHPETGFGYLRVGDKASNYPVQELQNFVEKPNQKLAEELIRDPNMLWNAGIFMFGRNVMRQELLDHAIDVLLPVLKSVKNGKWHGNQFHPSKEDFIWSPSISLDYAVMEKTSHAGVIAVDPGWSDLGSWSAVWENLPKDNNQNVVGESCFATASNSCFVRSDGPTVGVAGLEDVVVVASRDAVLVTSRSNPQHIKDLVGQIKDEGIAAAVAHPGEDRPWGRFDSIDKGDDHQVKRIRVDAGQRLSLQYHHHRAEHWVVVAGTATVTVDDTVQDLNVGEQIFIPKGAVHRLDNFTDEIVEIVEVQIGDYLGEDDIVRVEDVYGRMPAEAAQATHIENAA